MSGNRARHLTNEDVRQITENITGFFTLLAQWLRPGRHLAGYDTGRWTLAETYLGSRGLHLLPSRN